MRRGKIDSQHGSSQDLGLPLNFDQVNADTSYERTRNCKSVASFLRAPRTVLTDLTLSASEEVEGSEAHEEK